jgi:hypothetical protein
MDFSGDVKQAIPRPSPLLQGWREFRRSGAPVRFLCFEGGAWADVPADAALALRAAFLDTRVVAEAACGGRPFLFDFLRLARIDAATAEEVPMGWIDDRGACFFPAPHTARKRKRSQHEDGEGNWPNCTVVVIAKVVFKVGLACTRPYRIRVSCFPVNFLNPTQTPYANCTY